MSEEKLPKTTEEPAAMAVLTYLRKRGLGSAAMELQKHLEETVKRNKKDNHDELMSEDEDLNDMDASMETLEEKIKDEQSVLTRSTGGGIGYELDASPEIIKWGNNIQSDASSSSIHIMRKLEATELKDSIPETEENKVQQSDSRKSLNSFSTLHTWILSLPDKDAFTTEKNAITKSDQGDHFKSNHPPIISVIPPSVKPELLAISFPLLVHTYCDLLESGLENTANALLDSCRHIYQPIYPSEFLDLEKCNTTSSITSFNEVLLTAKEIVASAARVRLEYEKLNHQEQKSENKSDIAEKLESLKEKYNDLMRDASKHHDTLKSFPYLKRVRSFKSVVHLSTITFSYLARYLRSSDRLLSMSILIQSRLRIVTESRPPSTYIPSCVLEDMVLQDINGTDSTSLKDGKEINRKELDVRWAAPVLLTVRSQQAADLESTVLKDNDVLPFPKFHLESEYETEDDYKTDKANVEFNRALLAHGFRRLAAIETKMEFETGLRLIKDSVKVQDTKYGNALEPSIMLSTLCKTPKHQGDDIDIVEPDVNLICAKLCPPDGRRVAAGCSDSAIRIWSMESWTSLGGKGSVDSSSGAVSNESAFVLLGHKKGLPVFDLAWNPDGRTIISAGGDGSLRLWDTMAVGSYGEVVPISNRRISHSSGLKSTTITAGGPTTNVPGAKAEPTEKRHGMALVRYQGHSSLSPIWSVSIAPCGYYFASSGSDSTARLWCTDRPAPVRIFSGHYSDNINCITWHPNCNYVLSGSDDRTIRMWDVQSGNCVRLLSGCAGEVNKVEVSPSGQYVAGADSRGVVHLWDLRNGRKVDELDHRNPKESDFSEPISFPIQSMSWSPCGTTLATGTLNSLLHIWDIRGIGNNPSNPEYAAQIGWNNPNHSKIGDICGTRRRPHKTFAPNHTSILDLKFTKRNLLLSVGKYNGNN